MGFFNSVSYAPSILDDSWYSQAEALADVCRGPRRWLAGELWNGGEKYQITEVSTENIDIEEVLTIQSQGIQKVLRVVIGLLLSIPGEAVAAFFMAFAFTNEEIRLKHKVTVRELSADEKQKLTDLIEERQKLARERQGEPITCSILCSICCLLCCLVCFK